MGEFAVQGSQSRPVGARGGKYRERLLDYVTAFYTSQKKQTDIQTAFGLAPEELGAKVEAFAQKVMDGWRPPKEKAGG